MPLGDSAWLEVHVDGDGVRGAPPIVLLHGAGGTGALFAPLCARLAPHRTLAVSFPGRAGSTGPALEHVEALADVVTRAQAALGLGPCVLCGHSMGGAVALALALRAPAHVAGLVLVSTGARLRVAPPILDLWQQAAACGEGQSVSAAAFGADADPAEVARVASLERAIDPRTVLADWHATNGFDRLGALAAVTQPALVLCGDADVLTPPKYSEYLAAHLPRARVRLFAGAGHMLVFEQANLVADEVRAFVRELTNEAAG